MRLTYIYNAGVLIEHQKTKVLCDPWLSDGIYYGSWYPYPPLKVAPKDFFDVNYIYISHIHPDHLDTETLKHFPKEIPILICNYAHKFVYQILSKLGFKKIIELSQKVPMALGNDFQIEIIAADFCDPMRCQKHFACAPLSYNGSKTEQIDSLAVFKAQDKTLVNLNDVPYAMAQSALNYIQEQYPVIDCALVGYSGAGPYPQCFDHFSNEDKLIKAALKRQQFILQAVAFIKQLKPKFFIPFAGQYLLGGSLSHLNSFRGVPHLEELPNLFEFHLQKNQLESRLILLNSMEHFDLENERSSKPFEAPSADEREDYITHDLSKRSFSYEQTVFDEVELQANIQSAYDHLLKYYTHWNYKPEQNIYIDFGKSSYLCLPKDLSGTCYTQQLEEPYVKVVLDKKLFYLILNKKAHWNNAEIGSHLRFERKPDHYDRSLYFTLSYFHK